MNSKPGAVASFLILFLILPILAGPNSAGADTSADTRILIDISGSMKKNDPKNLRRPAVRMLVGLLPEKSRAGVWTFGKYVNMQVPLGIVDKAWKKRARAGASKIGSPGQYTNIEDAIKRSMRDWTSPADGRRRHMVLLTDGMVDVSKDPGKSAASRQRILEQLLPKLKQVDAKVHTIALSERADHELMKALSGETGGWYEQVESAEQLQRIFLRIFEKVGRPDTLPLKDNKFNVDASIEEVTLLVFRQDDAPPTRVVTPAGESFDAESVPSSVTWHRDQGYDLLTIARPEVGEWKIQAAVDPDNRVVVVTNLKMRATELPNTVVAGEQIPLTVHFTNGDKTITRTEFLDVVNLRAEQIDANGAGEPQPIYDDGLNADAEPGDGIFSINVGENVAAGKVEFIINAEGKTFQREQRQLFEVMEAVLLTSEPLEQADKPGLLVKVTPVAELLDMENYTLSGTLVSLEGERQGVMFLPSADGVSSEAWIDSGSLKGAWTLGVKVEAKSAGGHDISLDLEPVTVEGSFVEEVKVETAPEQPQETEVNDVPVVSEESYGIKEYSIIFGVGNLLLIVIAGVVFWIVRRRSAQDEIQLVDEGEAENQGPVTPETAESNEKMNGDDSRAEATDDVTKQAKNSMNDETISKAAEEMGQLRPSEFSVDDELMEIESLEDTND